MTIDKFCVKDVKKGAFASDVCENVKVVKTLSCFSVVQSVEGNYEISLDGGEFERTEEGGFFIAPAAARQTIIHRVNPNSGVGSFRWIFLSAEINGSLDFDTAFKFPLVLGGEEARRLSAIFDDIFSTDDEWLNYADGYRACAFLARLAEPAETAKDDVEKVARFIAENYRNRLTVSQLSRVANLSESRLFARFKKRFGCGPMAYVNDFRLAVAAEALAKNESSVNEIAYSVGIDDPLYFSKIFKRKYGFSPSKYREIYASVSPLKVFCGESKDL